MEAYKRWVRGNQHWLSSIENLANIATWLLPERLAHSELAPEALSTVIGLVTVLNRHIITTAPRRSPAGHLLPESTSSSGGKIPLALLVAAMKQVELFGEIAAEVEFGADNKWEAVAAIEAIKAVLRMGILWRNKGAMILNGSETPSGGTADGSAPESPPSQGPHFGAPSASGWSPPGQRPDFGPLPHGGGGHPFRYEHPDGGRPDFPDEGTSWGQTTGPGGQPLYPGPDRLNQAVGRAGDGSCTEWGRGRGGIAMHAMTRFRERLAKSAAPSWIVVNHPLPGGAPEKPLASAASPEGEKVPGGTPREEGRAQQTGPSWQDREAYDCSEPTTAGERDGRLTTQPLTAPSATPVGPSTVPPGTAGAPLHLLQRSGLGFSPSPGPSPGPGPGPFYIDPNSLIPGVPPFAPAQVPPSYPSSNAFPAHPRPPPMFHPLQQPPLDFFPPPYPQGYGLPHHLPPHPQISPYVPDDSQSASYHSLEGQTEGPMPALQLWLQCCQVAGDTAHILRPLVYVLLLRKYGLKSWKPWLLSGAVDVGALALSSARDIAASLQPLRSQGEDMADLENTGPDGGHQRRGLLPHERAEVSRRKMLLLLYLWRSPFFDTVSRPPLKTVESYLKVVPLMGTLAEKAMDFLLSIQACYFYTAAS